MSNLVGFGTFYYGLKHSDDGASTATKWLTALWLPLLPIYRNKFWVIANYQDNKNTRSGLDEQSLSKVDKYAIVDRLPISIKEVFFTYLKTYIGLPITLVAPLVIWIIFESILNQFGVAVSSKSIGHYVFMTGYILIVVNFVWECFRIVRRGNKWQLNILSKYARAMKYVSSAKYYKNQYEAAYDQMIKVFYKNAYFTTPLFSVFLISNYTESKTTHIPYWVFAVAIIVPLLAIFGSIRFRIWSTLQNLIRWLLYSLFPMFSLIFTDILISGFTSKESWLYRNYIGYYFLVFMLILLASLFWPKLNRRIVRRIKEKCDAAYPYVQQGTITASEVYRIFFKYNEQDQGPNSWKFLASIGSFATFSSILVMSGNGEYVLYYSFIASLLVTPFLLALFIHGAILYPRYLPRERTLIEHVLS